MAINENGMTRGELLRRGALGAAFAIGAGPLLSACGGSESQPIAETSASAGTEFTEVYLPSYLEDKDYRRIRELPLENVGRMVVSFMVPYSERARVPSVSPAMADMLREYKNGGGDISLAVGGYGASDADHSKILRGWSMALKNPQSFIDEVQEAADSIGANGVSIDFEYPLANQEKPLVSMMEQLKARMPETDIAMAVSATDATGYDLRSDGLPAIVDRFHVMAYDLSGSWSPEAGDLAPGTWAAQCIDRWIARIGDESKVSVGYPAYLRQFGGAQNRGDRFGRGKVADIAYSSLTPAQHIVDNPALLASSIENDPKGWITGNSPRMIFLTQEKIRAKHPNIAGKFYWAADGLTSEHLA